MTVHALNSAYDGGWIQTYSGRAFFPARPDSDHVHINDIAASLSKQCRYAGHCLRFYSVAEHCCHLADVAPDEHKLTALMHDASEAYLVDIPRPIKPLLREYKTIESNLMAVIGSKYGFDWPLPAAVTELDQAIMSDERAQNMVHMDVGAVTWGNALPALGITLQYWGPDKAEYEFLVRFQRLGGGM